jgi:hypothetical protein
MAYKHNDECIRKAGDDEMLFVLRAQDKSSPKVVLEWLKLNWDNPDMTEAKLKEAFNAALEMRRFEHRKEAD